MRVRIAAGSLHEEESEAASRPVETWCPRIEVFRRCRAIPQFKDSSRARQRHPRHHQPDPDGLSARLPMRSPDARDSIRLLAGRSASEARRQHKTEVPDRAAERPNVTARSCARRGDSRGVLRRPAVADRSPIGTCRPCRRDGRRREGVTPQMVPSGEPVVVVAGDALSAPARRPGRTHSKTGSVTGKTPIRPPISAPGRPTEPIRKTRRRDASVVEPGSPCATYAVLRNGTEGRQPRDNRGPDRFIAQAIVTVASRRLREPAAAL